MSGEAQLGVEMMQDVEMMFVLVSCKPRLCVWANNVQQHDVLSDMTPE